MGDRGFGSKGGDAGYLTANEREMVLGILDAREVVSRIFRTFFGGLIGKVFGWGFRSFGRDFGHYFAKNAVKLLMPRADYQKIKKMRFF